MRLGEAFLEALRRPLARDSPPETLRIAGVERFLGPNPYSIRPAIVCHFEATASFPLPEPNIRAVAGVLAGEGQQPIDFEDPAALSSIEALAGWAGRLAAALMQQWIGLAFGGGVGKPAANAATVALWVDLHDEDAATSALRVALSALAGLISGSPPAVEGFRAELAALRRLCSRRQPRPETQLMIAAARAADIPVLPVSGGPAIWQFGWGVRSELFWLTSSNSDGLVGREISLRKHWQKQLFAELCLPTPRWRLLLPSTDLARAVRHVGLPCVVKPTNQSGGRGVTANITSMEMLDAALALARPMSRFVILEAHQLGHNHRLMVVNGRLEMALRLDPPTVCGDGRRSLAELIDELNRQRAGDDRPGAPAQVPVDHFLALALESQRLTSKSVPEAGREVPLRFNANRATGGIAVSVLDTVHPSIRRYAELLAEATGFRTAGIDYVTPDIGSSHEDVGGGFLEINATPGMVRAVLSELVPQELTRLMIGPRAGRIPVALLIAAAPRLEEVARKLTAKPDEATAIATGSWARIGSVILPAGNKPPIDWVTALLRYRSVGALQILWTPEELLEWGLPVDSADCVVTLDAALDEPWSSLVADRAGEVLSARTAAEAVRLLKQRTRIEPGDGRA